MQQQGHTQAARLRDFLASRLYDERVLRVVYHHALVALAAAAPHGQHSRIPASAVHGDIGRSLVVHFDRDTGAVSAVSCVGAPPQLVLQPVAVLGLPAVEIDPLVAAGQPRNAGTDVYGLTALVAAALLGLTPTTAPLRPLSASDAHRLIVGRLLRRIHERRRRGRDEGERLGLEDILLDCLVQLVPELRPTASELVTRLHATHEHRE